MPGIKDLRRIQLGRESSAGVEVDATRRWRGTGVIEDNLTIIFPEENVGIVGGTDRSYIPHVEAGITFDPTPATFEQILHLLEAGICVDTPAQNGSGSGYVYEYQWPTTTQYTVASNLKTYTIEGGDDQQEEQFLYAVCKSIKLSGAVNQAVMMSATWFGRQVAPGTFTAAATIPTVEDVLFNKSKLYIDTTAGSFGGTQKTNTFLGFTLDLDNGWKPQATGDGNLSFSFAKQVHPAGTLQITFEHDATAVAEKAFWLAQTARKIRISHIGSALTSVGGGSYTTKIITLDVAGKWEKFDPMDDDDGNDTVTGTFRIGYDATAAQNLLITVVNELSAVP
jgi:hypothetical protein